MCFEQTEFQIHMNFSLKWKIEEKKYEGKWEADKWTGQLMNQIFDSD